MARPGRLPYAIVDLVAEIKRARPDADEPDIEPFVMITLDRVSFFAALGEANNYSGGHVVVQETDGHNAFAFGGVTFTLGGS